VRGVALRGVCLAIALRFYRLLSISGGVLMNACLCMHPATFKPFLTGNACIPCQNRGNACILCQNQENACIFSIKGFKS
jgi:hypothetical protein